MKYDILRYFARKASILSQICHTISSSIQVKFFRATFTNIISTSTYTPWLMHQDLYTKTTLFHAKCIRIWNGSDDVWMFATFFYAIYYINLYDGKYAFAIYSIVLCKSLYCKNDFVQIKGYIKTRDGRKCLWLSALIKWTYENSSYRWTNINETVLVAIFITMWFEGIYILCGVKELIKDFFFIEWLTARTSKFFLTNSLTKRKF